MNIINEQDGKYTRTKHNKGMKEQKVRKLPRKVRGKKSTHNWSKKGKKSF